MASLRLISRRSFSVAVAAEEAHPFIRPFGCTRRLFLQDPYYSPAALSALAQDIHTLTQNEAINSVLIGPEEPNNMLSYIRDLDLQYAFSDDYTHGYPDENHLVSGVLDPSVPLTTPMLQHAQALAKALRGDPNDTKVPTIAVLDGYLHDAGAAWLQSSYVIGTSHSFLQVQNPCRGLSFDPVGLSYRLKYMKGPFRRSIALILGLTGYTANADDLFATGLVTHQIETPSELGILENVLAQLPSWKDQALIHVPKRNYGDRHSDRDHNRSFRNVTVADAIEAYCGGLELAWDEATACMDASLDPEFEEHMPTLESTLVNYAATLDDLLEMAKTPEDVMEALQQVAAEEHPDDPEEQEGVEVAKKLLKGMQKASPLALSAIFRLVDEPGKTFEACLEQEMTVQQRLIQGPDYASWQEREEGWTHSSLKAVTNDEVEALFQPQEASK